MESHILKVVFNALDILVKVTAVTEDNQRLMLAAVAVTAVQQYSVTLVHR
jgi:hypothetical protein